ncbi:hypothetical protein CIHG_03287 [Coccidioides immitis H538.4]|uniref:Uncharacterized protein n=1 Tax=Coccidioides immitis H538.4 TaxID=396776 RepID=A0A0J8RND7_COCIT|nr:hypothetical protein CIHG_03287 [Coccidioides immitis H538.4]
MGNDLRSTSRGFIYDDIVSSDIIPKFHCDPADGGAAYPPHPTPLATALKFRFDPFSDVLLNNHRGGGIIGVRRQRTLAALNYSGTRVIAVDAMLCGRQYQRNILEE